MPQIPTEHGPARLVMDVGGSHVTAARVSVAADGVHSQILDRSDASLDSQGSRDEIVGRIVETARPLESEGAAWTIAMPGPFDYERGTGDFDGIGKFDGIAGIDLRGALAEGLAAPRDDIRFVNDAVAYGIGEWAFGDARDRPDRLICLTLGTGVGSVFLQGGKPVTEGDEVPRHGFAHTIEYDGRPLEETVSTRAIRNSYRAAGGDDVDVARIAERARAGDTAARVALADALTALGRAIGPWAERFGASRLVVGGAMSRSWSLLDRPLREGLAETPGLAALQVMPARLGDDAPLFGAAEWTASVGG